MKTFDSAGAKSSASPVAFDDRQAENGEGEQQRAELILAPCSTTVAVNEAVHAFVGVTGDEHLDDTEVDVHSSTGERARVTIRGSAREALASLPASTRAGPRLR